MRVGRYIAAELLILAVLSVGSGLGVRALWGLRGRPRVPAATGREVPGRGIALPLREEPSPPPEPAILDEAPGTFFGMSDDVLIERIRTQPIERMKLNKGGSSLSFRVDLADGSRAAFKPAQTNLQTIPRKEVAAYRLNRLLGLNAVPPAAPRMVSRDEIFSHLHPDSLQALPRIRSETIFNPTGQTAGVVMYWVPVIKDSGLDTPEGIDQSTQWLSQGKPIPPASRSLAAQLSQLLVFDFLTSNPDRFSGGNMLTNGDGSRLLFMDNTMSFFVEPNGSEHTRSALRRVQRFSRRLYDALDRVTVPALQQVLSQAGRDDYEILTPAEIRAVVARRDFVKQYIDKLIVTHGRREVLVFP